MIKYDIGLLSAFYLVFIYFENSLFFYFMDQKHRPQKHLLTFWLAFVPIATSFLLVFGYLFNSPYILPLGFVFSIVLYCSAFCYISPACTGKKIFIFLFYIILFLMFFTLTELIASFPFATRYNETLIRIPIRLMLYIVFYIIYCLFIRDLFEKYTQHLTEGWGYINMVCIVFVILQSYVCLRQPLAITVRSSDLWLLFGVFLLTYLVFFVIFYHIYYLHIANEMQQQQMQEELLHAKLQHLAEIEQETVQARRNWQYHNDVLIEFAKNGETNAILQYLEEQQAATQIRFCLNETANGVLILFSKKAKAQGVAFTCSAHLFPETSLPNKDIVAILSSVLELALSTCATCPSPMIQFKMHPKSNKLMIACDSTCDNALTLPDDCLSTPEHIRSNHTTALAQITQVAQAIERYRCITDLQNQDGTLSTRIILHLPS